MKDSYPLNINHEVINSENCVKLLTVQTNNKLSFEKRKKKTQKRKKANRLNIMSRIQTFMGFKEK